MNQEQFDKYLKIVEKGLEKYKLDYDCEQSKLFNSVNYSLLAHGKRLRPIMLLAACEMAGGNTEDSLPFAIGLEMIHNSSLIHDDLPAMDNDDLRRGRATNHIVYGEATAILAGDVLLVRPFEIMADSIKSKEQAKAMSIIAKAAGQEGMMGGQQIDLDCEGIKADSKTIIRLNELKTGALFIASIKAGVVIGGADERQIAAAESYGRYMGIAFQLVDDLLDNSKLDIGKSKGSDIENNKSTYLSVYGEEKCRKLIDEYTLNAQKAIEMFGDKAEFLSELVEWLTNRVK